MAEVVAEFPRDARGRKFEGSRYNKFFDGQVWKLEMGKDCSGHTSQVYSIIRKAATRFGVRVAISVRSKEGCVYVQAVGKIADEPQPA